MSSGPADRPTIVDIESLEAALRAHVERGEVTGLSWLVAAGDDVASGCAGTLGPDGRPVAVDTIYRISSLTKPLTAALALVLVEQGVVALDDPVDDLLPELADRRVLADPAGPLEQTVPAARPITLRDVLTFRMGIGADFARWGQQPVMEAMSRLSLGAGPPAPQTFPPRDEWLRRLGTLPLERQPGERWLYDSPADVLGALIERATGRALGEALGEHVLAPLGMTDTSFAVPRASAARFGDCFVGGPAAGGRRVHDPADGQWSRQPAFASGAGGLVSTVDDYFAFADALRRGTLLRPSTVAEMTTNALTPAQLADLDPSGGLGWGLGLSVRIRADLGEPVGTYGWDGGLGAFWRTDPHRDVVAILFTNQVWDSPGGPDVVRTFRRCAFAP